MAWLETKGTHSSTPGIWIEYKDRNIFYSALDTDICGYKSGIRKITKNLATAGWSDNIPLGWRTVDVWKNISDNEIFIKPVKDKIKEVLSLLSKGQKVCIRCACGMNRSNTLAVAVLTYLDRNSGLIKVKWLRYRNLVISKVDRAWLNPDLEYTCQQAVKELKDSK